MMHGIFAGSVLSFEVDNKPAFELPLKDVSQATTGKIVIYSKYLQIRNIKLEIQMLHFQKISQHMEYPKIEYIIFLKLSDKD